MPYVNLDLRHSCTKVSRVALSHLLSATPDAEREDEKIICTAGFVDSALMSDKLEVVRALRRSLFLPEGCWNEVVFEEPRSESHVSKTISIVLRLTQMALTSGCCAPKKSPSFCGKGDAGAKPATNIRQAEAGFFHAKTRPSRTKSTITCDKDTLSIQLALLCYLAIATSLHKFERRSFRMK